jgi:hypothetical protein
MVTFINSNIFNSGNLCLIDRDHRIECQNPMSGQVNIIWFTFGFNHSKKTGDTMLKTLIKRIINFIKFILGGS